MAYENEARKRSRASFRNVMDIGMGIFYLVIGSILVYAKRFGLMQIPGWVAYVLGTIMIIGGAFRFYKGLKAVLPAKDDTDPADN